MTDALFEAIRLLWERDPYTLQVIALSFQVAAASLVIAAGIGIPIGLILGMTRFAGRLGLLVIINAAMGLPPVVAGLVTFLLLRSQGPLGDGQLLFTPAAMVIAQVPLAVPLIAGITMAGIAGMPRGLRQQVRALGASRMQEARLVIRQTRHSIVASCIAGFGVTISEVGAILITGGNLLVGGRNYTRTMSTAIVLETRQGNLSRAVAFSIILLASIVVVNVFLTRAQLGRSR